MATLRGKKVRSVWLVHDGFGGHIFDLCESEDDAKRNQLFNRGYPGLIIQEMNVMTYSVQEDAKR